jgi:hypothetical protein
MRSESKTHPRLDRQPGEDDLDALMRKHRRDIPGFDKLVAKELAALRLGIKIADARRVRRRIPAADIGHPGYPRP